MLANETLIWLSQKQTQLDDYILKNNNLSNDSEMFKKKIVAFLVELGEYANEERSFKYWSKRPAAGLEVQLDEYIDGLHFLISLGNDLEFDFATYKFQPIRALNQVDAYLVLLQNLSQFIQTPTLSVYRQILDAYLTIAQLGQYLETDLIQAYQKKNQINFDRQNQNY